MKHIHNTIFLPALALLALATAAIAQVPPVMVTNLVLQKYGEEAKSIVFKDGQLFWDAEHDALFIGDGENHGGRAVCPHFGKNYDIDWHVFHKTLQVNGNDIQFNQFWTQVAEGGTLAYRFGTNTWLRFVGTRSGELANLSIDARDVTNGTMTVTADAVNDPILQVSTNLVSADPWQTATNATVTSTTDVSTTWTIDLLDTTFQVYRVLATTTRPVGIHALRPLYAHQGLYMDGERWDAWPDVGGIATNAANAAVTPVEERVGTLETNAALHATKSELVDATNTLAGLIYNNEAALACVTNALGQRISEYETVTIAYAPTAVTANVWFAPTNCPTRALDVQINSIVFNNTNTYCEIRIPAGYTPKGPMRLRFYVWRTHTNARHRFGIGDNAHVTVTGPNSRFVEYEWMPESQKWQIHFLQANNGFDCYDSAGVRMTANFGLPTTIEAWIAWRSQQTW